MRVLLLALALLGAVSTTSAQPNLLQFRPLAVGDTWVFNSYQGTQDPFVTNYSVSSVSQYRVTGDTLIDGAAYRVVEVSTVASGVATPLCSAGVAYDVAGEATLVRLAGSPTALQCVRIFAFALSPGTVTTHSPGTYLVGSTPTTFATVRQTREQGFTSGGRRFERDVYFAAGVGVIAFGQIEDLGTNAFAFSNRLQYARVGGQEYGMNPVAGEDGPQGTASFAVRAYPVPARRSVTVEVGQAASVEVVDGLGRRVAWGEAAPGQPLWLDVSAWPAGVYVARAVGGSGGQTVRLVVAR